MFLVPASAHGVEKGGAACGFVMMVMNPAQLFGAAPQKIFWSRAAPRKIQHSFEDRIVSHLHGAVRDAVVEGRLEPFYSAAAQEGISTLTSVSADASHKLQELIGSLCGESEGHGRCQRVAVHTHSGHALQRGGLADSHERRAYLQAVCE